MSTGGQAVGGIVGAIAGVLLAPATAGASLTWAMYGGQAGMLIGGLLDPPKGPSQHGPSPDALRLTTSTYGASIPRLYGTVPVAGNVLWLEGGKYKVKKKKSGGKGGGGIATYKLFATFAVLLGKGEIVGIRRLSLAGNLVYDGAAPTTAGVIKSGKSKSTWKLYTGTDTQQPDPRYQADVGVNAASGWPGEAVLFFYDLPLEKYQNTLAGVQIKAEIVTDGSYSWGLIDSANFAPTFSSNPSFYGHIQCVTGSTGWFFEPQWNNDYTQLPYSFKVWSISSGLDKALRGIVSTGISSGQAIQLSGKLDIAAAAVKLNSPDAVIVVDRYGELRTFMMVGSTSYGFDQVRVRKLGGRFYVASALIDGSYGSRAILRYDWSLAGYPAASSPPPLAPIADMDVFGDELFAMDASGNIYVYDADDLTYLETIATSGGSNYRCLCVIAAREFYVTRGTAMLGYADGAWVVLSGITAATASEDQDMFALGNTLWLALPRASYVYALSIAPAPSGLDEIVEAECLQSNLLTAADLDVTGLAADTVRGYRVSDTGPIRASLEPLSMVWPFDVRMHGYKLQFVRRGGASVASIPAADLDARMEGSDPGPLLTLPRDMDSQLPQKVVLGFLDVDREYDRGEQSAARYNTDARNIAEPEVAIVLNAQEAKRAAEVLLYNYWRERLADIQLNLPPTWLHLEPADVVDITAPDGAVHVLRLTNINTTPAGIQQCTARRDKPGGYTSTAVAETGTDTGAGLIVYGPTLDVLLDIPALTATENTPGFYAAACGVLATWPGAILYTSYDGGQDWDDIAVWDNDSFIGIVPTALGAATCFDRIDAAGTLTVSPYAGTLASVTEAQMLAGANHFSYGVHGRWEILAARTVTLNGDGTYTLQDFLRGRLGTEQYAGAHQAGDLLVQLTSSETVFVGRSTAQIGLAGLFRPVTLDEDFDEVSDEAFTYTGVNLKPLSPVNLNGNRHPSTNDWTLTVVPRHRINTEWRDYVDVPEDEASSSYQMDIYADGTYATVKRTLSATGTSPSFGYSSANQVTDFGSNQATLYTKSYKISATVGRGYPLTASITR
jgi:putative tail protein